MRKLSVARYGCLTNPLHRIAARLRFLLNPKSSGLGSER